MAEYARAMETIDEEPEADDSTSEETRRTLERVSSGHIFPISITEIRGNKLMPIQEHPHPDHGTQLNSTNEAKFEASGISTPRHDGKAQSRTRSGSFSRPSPGRSPRDSSSSRSVDTSISKISTRSPTKSSPSTPPAGPLKPPQETASSRLRRERLSQVGGGNHNLPFGYSKSSALKPIPNSPIEPQQKTERKPYIDYLRQKVSGKPSSSAQPPPAPAEKKH
jgi:hypothetical protein